MSKNKALKPVLLFNTLSITLIVVIVCCYKSVNSFKLINSLYNYFDIFGDNQTEESVTTSGGQSALNPRLVRQLTTAAVPFEASGGGSSGLTPELYGFRAEGDGQSTWIDKASGLTIFRISKSVNIRIFGYNLNQTDDLLIGFTNNFVTNHGSNCQPNNNFQFKAVAINRYTGIVTDVSIDKDEDYYICIGSNNNSEPIVWTYATGDDSESMHVRVESPLLPLWLQCVLIVLLLAMSGLFSGLNLGLMALDKNELKVIERCGTEDEKRFAKQITPVRKRGNYLLCTLLLGNVLVNSTLTIFLDDLTSGIIAVISSTLSIVIFGEIIPQALCSRHGLAVGARTVWLTYIFMVLTFPLSFPISKILDKVLGEEIGNVYDRERLMEFIRVTKDHNRLDADEVNIISGALKLSKIKVVEIMTQINDVFMLPYNTILNFETMTKINSSGFSRIPIYEGDKNNVVAILHAKDLAFTDADNSMPIKALIEYYKHPLYFVYEDVTLDVMLNEFKQGKSHMAFVRRIIDDGINDPVYELAGVVTLEDVFEELIQCEINDETDVISDNRRKQKRKEVVNRPNYSDFLRLGGGQESVKVISSQLALAAFRYLSSFVEPFKPELISDQVLKRIIAKKIYFDIKVDPKFQFELIEKIPSEYRLYTCGKPADYFILILEGRVKVLIGKENQVFECGPFTPFGTLALKFSAVDNDRVSKSTSLGRLSITDGTQPHSGSQDGLKTSASTTSTTGYRSSISVPVTDSPMTVREGAFIPDFTVFCIENTSYMKVTRLVYLTALRTSMLERQRQSDSHSNGPDHEDDTSDIIHFGSDLNAESNKSATNLLSNSDQQPGIKLRSTSSITSKSSPTESLAIPIDSIAPAEPVPPKYDDTIAHNNSIKANSNSVSKHNSNLVINDNSKTNSTESIDSLTNSKRISSPTDEKSHLI